jgi:hypothetical protein
MARRASHCSCLGLLLPGCVPCSLRGPGEEFPMRPVHRSAGQQGVAEPGLLARPQPLHPVFGRGFQKDDQLGVVGDALRPVVQRAGNHPSARSRLRIGHAPPALGDAPLLLVGRVGSDPMMVVGIDVDGVEGGGKQPAQRRHTAARRAGDPDPAQHAASGCAARRSGCRPMRVRPASRYRRGWRSRSPRSSSGFGA